MDVVTDECFSFFLRALEAIWAQEHYGFYDYSWGSCNVNFLNTDTECIAYVSSQGFNDPHLKNLLAGGVPQRSPPSSILF